MYAVFKSGGKQHRVSVGDILKLELLDAEVGGKVVFDQVLLAGGDGDAKVGTPLLGGASVEAEVSKHGRHKKIEVYKRKRRKGFQKKAGHRQPFTEVKITDIKA